MTSEAGSSTPPSDLSARSLKAGVILPSMINLADAFCVCAKEGLMSCFGVRDWIAIASSIISVISPSCNNDKRLSRAATCSRVFELFDGFCKSNGGKTKFSSSALHVSWKCY